MKLGRSSRGRGAESMAKRVKRLPHLRSSTPVNSIFARSSELEEICSSCGTEVEIQINSSCRTQVNDEDEEARNKKHQNSPRNAGNHHVRPAHIHVSCGKSRLFPEELPSRRSEQRFLRQQDHRIRRYDFDRVTSSGCPANQSWKRCLPRRRFDWGHPSHSVRAPVGSASSSHHQL